MHDVMTTWQRLNVEELDKRRLGDRDDWGEKVSLMILGGVGRQVEWVGRMESQEWTMTACSFVLQTLGSVGGGS